jgi:hypothetical protein
MESQKSNRFPHYRSPILERIVALSDAYQTGLSEVLWDANWQCEIELWLEFLSDEGQLDRYVPRISRSDQAKAFEALDEVKSAYFLTLICGFGICEWEPRGQGEKVGEFTLEVRDARIFCEVKSPGWEREMVKLHGEYSQRLAQPKYLSGEGGSFDNTEDIRDAVERAYEEFPDTQSCLLIFNSDLMVSPLKEANPGGIPLSVNGALYDRFNDKDGCFTSTCFERCGGVLFLDVDQFSQGVTYTFQLFENPHATLPLPAALRERLVETGGTWTRQPGE